MSIITDALTKLKDGIAPEGYDLQKTAEDLFIFSERRPLNYWGFLLISAEIADLGLVMDSPTVVIGAMLISPLMIPLLQTGMAFAVGNIRLATRAIGRVVASILFVISLTSFTTMLVPIHQVTSQIDARSQPTALDLLVAFFVAIIACWTSLQRSNDTVTAAAGTAVSISLVPPLCVAGFGLGTLDRDILLGSSLLFTANFAAIILVSDLFFIAMGFPDIDDKVLENKVFEEQKRHPVYFFLFRLLDRINKRIFRGMKINIFLPVLFVSAISVPLFRGLSLVAWEVKTREKIESLLEEFNERYPILDNEQALKSGHVAISLTIVADPGQRDEIASLLSSRLQEVLGTEPSLALEIIPSPEYVRNRFKVQTDLLTKRFSSSPQRHQYGMPASLQEVREQMPVCLQNIRGAMDAALAWMNGTTTEPEYAGWSCTVRPRGTTLEVLHISDEGMSRDARELIAAYVKKEAGIDAVVSERRMPRSVFRAQKDFSARVMRCRADKALSEARKEPAVGVEVILKSPQMNKGTKTDKVNAIVLDYVKARVPNDRIIMKWMDFWGINLFVIREKQPSKPLSDRPPRLEKGESNPDPQILP